MPKISIIVPVYQVEKYLAKCVDSILDQTFTDFELILVDDGSTDRGPAMCDQYAKRDERVKVIHKKNGGLSDARNAGIDIAQGDYLGFVDSDDYIAADMYDLLYHDITKEQADLAICGIYDVYEGHEPKQKDTIRDVMNQQQAIKVIFEGNIVSVHAVNKLYRRAIFKKLRYPIGKYHEDSFVILDILEQCQKIVIDSQQKYFYYHREGSINTERFSPSQFDFIEAWQKNDTRLAKMYPQLADVGRQRVCFANFMVLDKLVRGHAEHDYSETKTIVHYLRSNFWFIMKNPIFTKQRKVSMILLTLSLRLYRVPVMIQKKHNS
ncbi:glycosyltransferase family 2 protein [Lapidilactobacillus bayanensis]|uniref:glycosyltransferase family 2 protein n=1 Tax=Lapidilactobacillus bayanensis TaxID=2485998 RepID=UPI000F77FD72|nr:glycosyltransferase [Lapidilactobacillus bayanensis]